MYYRDTYAKIDCDAIAHNLSLLKKQSSKALIAVLKANAYGHKTTGQQELPWNRDAAW